MGDNNTQALISKMFFLKNVKNNQGLANYIRVNIVHNVTWACIVSLPNLLLSPLCPSYTFQWQICSMLRFMSSTSQKTCTHGKPIPFSSHYTKENAHCWTLKIPGKELRSHSLHIDFIEPLISLLFNNQLHHVSLSMWHNLYDFLWSLLVSSMVWLFAILKLH